MNDKDQEKERGVDNDTEAGVQTKDTSFFLRRGLGDARRTSGGSSRGSQGGSSSGFLGGLLPLLL